MLFLYDLPNWLMGVVIIATILAFTYAGYFAFHRAWCPVFGADDRNVAMTVLGVIATINSLLLAFSAVSVWESFGAADEAVVAEANSVGALSRDLAIFDSVAAREARLLLRDYAEQVVQTEWAGMQRGGPASEAAWRTFDRMFVVVGRMEPDTPRRVALLPEIWARLNELLKERRSRLFASQSEVPGTLWWVVMIGTMVTIGTTFVLPPTRFNLGMIGLLTLSVGLVFYLVIAMDRPFAGKESISPEPFESAIENMERWDAEIAGAVPAPRPPATPSAP